MRLAGGKPVMSLSSTRLLYRASYPPAFYTVRQPGLAARGISSSSISFGREMGDLGWGPRIRYLVFGLSRSSFGAEGYTGPDYARVEGHTGLDHAASRGTVGGAHTYTHTHRKRGARSERQSTQGDYEGARSEVDN
jgi:hypothetical protein